MITNMTNGKGKKIVLLGHIDGHGGAQTAFKRLVEFAMSENYDFRVIALTNQNQDSWLSDKKCFLLDTIIYQAPSTRLKLKKLIGIYVAGIKARLFKPDIFVTVGLNNTANTLARIIGGSAFKIAQDFNADRMPDDKLWHKSKLVNDGIALQAPSMINYWKDNGVSTDKVDWLPCFPVPPVPKVLHQRIEDSDDFRMAYFGRLAGNKGLDLLLESLTDENVPVAIKLDIWGKGDEEQVLRELCQKLRLTDRVNFMGGYPDGTEGAELMAAYDLLVLCSTRTEGLPLILLEAMAYGLPLLVTDIGAIGDCCVNNPDALLVRPDKESITAGIVQAHTMTIENQFDPLRQQRYYKAFFSYDVMAKRWRDCLSNPVNFFA